jgi:molecular chaperone DnaK
MAIGIDLGTTYSVMAYVKADGRAEVIPNSEGQRVTPSSVMFDEDDSVVVGEIAKESSIVDSCSVIEYIKNDIVNIT